MGKSGFVSFAVPAGSHSVELSQYGEFLGEFDFATATADQNAEIQVEMIGGEALPEVNLYTPGQEQAAALGQISGYLESEDTGGAISGARISVTGTEQAVVTDEDGFFSFELPRGEYDLVISDPNYGKRDVSGVRVMSNVNTGVNLNLSLEGEGVIEEVVAVGSYIPSTATAQQRDASAVLDAIGSEQFSRFGDSNAASALKRVTGVTVADGKYAVVRGLNERYTSVLFNGGMVPSPDPTRRVVPLDLFPSGIISSVNVEKTAVANRPTDAAGATIDILTKDAPEEFEGKLSVSLGYTDGTTGESVNAQKTSGNEFLGFGSSDRDLSSSAKNLTGEALGKDGADTLELSQWKTAKKDISPDVGIELSLGDLIAETETGTVAYKVTGRYSNSWEYNETDRANYQAASRTKVQEADEYIQYRLVNLIDLSFGGTLSLVSDNYTINSNTLMLRQTQADNVEEVGVRGEDRDFVIEREYTWQERKFFTQQFVGEHFFDDFYGAELGWGLTLANASMYVPDSRSYRLFDADVNNPIDNSFNPLADDRSATSEIDFSTKPKRDWTDLDDDSVHFRLDGLINLIEESEYQLKLASGLSVLTRERDVESHSFQYDRETALPEAVRAEQDIANVLTNKNFEAGYFSVRNNSDDNASYTGNWDYSALYLMPTLEWYDVFTVELGVRLEDSKMDIKTAGDTPTIAKIEDNDVYPSLNSTYSVTEDSQVRFAFSTAVNRPDFREVAPAQFTDSVSGDRYVGNESLTESTVTSLDLRYEYYFSDDESINVAIFRKDFEDAIERTSTVISGSSNDVLYSFDNNGDAYAQGIEFSASKSIDTENIGYRLTGNFAYFDTEIDIFTDSGNFDRSRRMQGQPDMLGNLQVAMDELESGREYTLVVNYTGESLSAVTTSDVLKDEFREPRMVVDANFKQPLLDDQLALKLSLKNITDSEVKETQGGSLTKSYKPGREINLSLSYQF
ncbi:MAG: TonB-dependent receptor [Saccharospirillaceae bacterium]|nr:TonB-dependent receptor [Saccharospirillaceae bacterium]